MSDLEIRGPYTPVGRHQFATTGPTLTHQSMADECDINKIMLKWQKSGVLEHRNTYEGQYGDFTNVPQDYHESMNQVLAAEDMFQSLPSSIRKKFGNDPQNYLDFATDPANHAEMVDLGLSEPRTDVLEDADDPTPPKKAKAPQKAAPAPEEE